MTRCTCTLRRLTLDEFGFLQELYADADDQPIRQRIIHDRRCPIHGHPQCNCLPVVDAEIDVNKQVGWSALLCPIHAGLEDAE